MARSVRDPEAALARAVDQVRGAVRQVLQYRLRLPELENIFRAGVAVLADQNVHVFLLAKTFQPRREDQQLAAVRHGFARAVDRLVRDPRAVEFVALHDRHDLFQRRDDRDVLLPGEFGSLEVRLQIVTDEDAGVAEISRFVVGHHDLEIEVGEVPQVVGLRLVVAGAQGRNERPQIVLDAAAGRRHVRRADHRLAAQPDEVVFVVVREAKDLVRDNVANVNDQIPLAIQQERIERDRDRPIDFPVRRFLHEIDRNLADRPRAVAPVVHVDPVKRDRAEHPAVLLVGVRDVLAERRDDVNVGGLGEDFVELFRDPPCSAVGASNVRRKKQDALRIGANAFAGFVSRLVNEGKNSVAVKATRGGNPRHDFSFMCGFSMEKGKKRFQYFTRNRENVNGKGRNI